MSSLRIAEVAESAGVSTATVRYYERVGVLPPAPRGRNNYRTYDERTVERLAFIRRAKQLGCTLEEIGELATAWEGGSCGPIQDRMRALVAEKRERARSEIADLAVFTHDLRRAEASLERHRPVGACDERCGCLPETDDGSEPVTLGRLDPSLAEAVGCTLARGQIDDRVAAWQRLVGDGGPVATRLAIEDGIRLEFEAGVDMAEVARLATAEHDCCRFLSFRLTIDERGLGLEVTTPPSAAPVLEALLGRSA